MNKDQIKGRAEETKGKAKEATGVMLNNNGYGDRRKCPKERRQDRRGLVI